MSSINQSAAAVVTVAADQATETKDFASAFQRVEPELRTLSEEELLPINIDIPSAIATVLGALPEVEQELPRIAALGGIDRAAVENLRDYAGALAHAHAAYRAASGPVDHIGDIADRIFETRDQLLADATALGRRGVLEMERVDKLRSGLGFKNAAFDVIGLVGLLRERWTAIGGRTAITTADLDNASDLAEDLITAVGLKEQAPATVGAAALVRQQAFTAFVRAYDETRRALAFIHWRSGRADEIAPSLYQGRGGRKSQTTETQPQAPPSAVTTPNTPAAPVSDIPIVSAPAATPDVAPAAQNPITPPAPPIPVGLPGSSPFRQS